MADINYGFLQSLFENNCAIMLLVDPASGDIVDANGAASEFYGWPIDRIRQMKIWDVNTLPPDQVLAKMSLARAMTQNHFSFRHKTASGEIRDVEVLSCSMRNAQTNLLYSIVRDVTESKRRQQAAARQMAFERTILHFAQHFINMPVEALDDAIRESLSVVLEYCRAAEATVWKFDEKSRRIVQLYRCDVCPGEETEYCGVTREQFAELFGRMQTEVVELDAERTPQSADLLRQMDAQSVTMIPLALAHGSVGALSILTREKKKERTEMELTALRIFAEMLTSVLQRKEEAQELLASKQKIEMILDSTSDGVAMFDYDGTILSVNETMAKRFHISEQSAIGLRTEQYLPADRYGDLAQNRLNKIREAYDMAKPVVLVDERDGILFENRYYPVFKDGKVSAVTLFSTDITYRKKAEEEAESRAEYQARLKVVTDFFTNVSHEFKTPLSVILLQLEMMGLCMNDPDKMRKLIDVATQNSYRLTRLVSNLLDITKLDAGFIRPTLENVDIAKLTQEICETVLPFAQAKGVELRIESAVGPGCLPADTEKFERILLNLLSNAIKHTDAGGVVAVSLQNKGESGIVLSVSDTGEGIPEDKQRIIFDRFAQVDTAFSKKNEGCGIGLSLAKSLAAILGGDITVRSVPGKGSTFTVTLPWMEPDLQAGANVVSGYDLRKKTEMEFSDVYYRR